MNEFAKKHARIPKYSHYPMPPSKNDTQTEADYRKDLDKIERRAKYMDGLHVNSTYTTIAHFWLITKYAQMALTILRTYYNFCFAYKTKDRIGTPAQRLGITKRIFNLKDIIYMQQKGVVLMAITDLCEACKRNEINVVEASDEPNQPYKLCNQCHERLLKYSLRPIEWYNLAVVHSPKKFLLHDDFYEEDGEACQPEEDVIVTKKDKAPTLQEVRNDLESLLDFSITRWFLEDDVIKAFKKHDNQKTLSSVKSRFYGTENYEVKSRMLEIVADVLGTSASEWVRELWRNYDEEFLYPISWATASSLPAEEGLNNVFEKLKLVNEKELPKAAFTCLYRFRSSNILDWMESTCTIFNDKWGRLAAVCFPTWERTKSWLNKGRPLSLIALDTMANCVKGYGDIYVEQFSPKIIGTDKNEVEQILNDYYQKDSVPRVKMKLSKIVENQQAIFE